MAKGNFGGGLGTLADPFLIEDAYDMYAIRFGLNKAYRLINNINLDVPPFNAMGWQPIPGTFIGILDGNCKKIFNLKINRPDMDYVGLFSKVSIDFYGPFQGATGVYNSRICNLSIENAQVVGRNYVGILAGNAYARMESNIQIYDSSGLILEKIHLSGKITGLNYVGGMFGWFQPYSNSAYNWRLMEDCFIDVVITAQSDLTFGGLMFGMMYGTLGFNPRFNDNICKGYYIYNGGTATNMWSAYPTYDTAINPILENSAYDSTIWNGKATAAHRPKTSAKMLLKEEFANLELKKISTGGSVWVFGFNKYPQLWFLALNNIFIKADDKYYIYDATNSQWIEKYDRIPSLIEAVRDGMKSLADIDRNAWNVIKATNPIIDIINIVDKSVGLTIKDNVVVLDRNIAKDYLNKQVYKKTMAINDFDHGIFMAERAVND